MFKISIVTMLVLGSSVVYAQNGRDNGRGRDTGRVLCSTSSGRQNFVLEGRASDERYTKEQVIRQCNSARYTTYRECNGNAYCRPVAAPQPQPQVVRYLKYGLNGTISCTDYCGRVDYDANRFSDRRLAGVTGSCLAIDNINGDPYYAPNHNYTCATVADRKAEFGLNMTCRCQTWR